MKDVLQYAGKRAVVTGCASGMGQAAAEILVDLGAEVVGLDVKPTSVPVASFHEVDLRDRAAIDAAIGAIDGPVHSIFSVAGLPGPPFSDLDTVVVNFIGARHLIEGLVPKLAPGAGIVCVASNAGLGWQQQVAELMPLVSNADFQQAVAWCEAHPEKIEPGYVASKRLLNLWVAWRGATLVENGIRLNCTNPGPTDTAMMPQFEENSGKETIDAFIGPSGRRSTSEEQAWPMIFLNSPRCSYVAGEALHTDAGFLGAMVTGQIQISIPS